MRAWGLDPTPTRRMRIHVRTKAARMGFILSLTCVHQIHGELTPSSEFWRRRRRPVLSLLPA